MGFGNMDFVIRELAFCVLNDKKNPNPNKEFLFIRIGTCGSPCKDVKVGSILVPSESHYCMRLPDKEKMEDMYYVSKGYLPDKGLMELLAKNCTE